MTFNRFIQRFSPLGSTRPEPIIFSRGKMALPEMGGNGGVCLYDLADDSIKTLAEPDNGGQYSLARFCSKGVLYMRKQVLWRMDLDGSNNVPMFQASPSRLREAD